MKPQGTQHLSVPSFLLYVNQTFINDYYHYFRRYVDMQDACEASNSNVYLNQLQDRKCTYNVTLRSVRADCWGEKTMCYIFCVQWRTEEGGWGVQTPPRHSEGPPKWCQTQPYCENC